MKKLIFFAVSSIMVSLILSCKYSGQSSETLATDTVTFHRDDSLKVDIGGDSIYSHLTTDIYVDWPSKGNTILTNAIKEFIDEQLGGNCPDTCLKQGVSMVNYYGRAYDDSLHSVLNNGGGLGFCYNAKLGKEYESNSVVSYSSTICIGLGGAHPMTSFIGVSFRKNDGRRLGYEIFRNDPFTFDNQGQPSLISMIKSGLTKYFKVKNEEELKQMLLLNNEYSEIPLPANPPYFGKNGIVFTYGQYEIAPYAAGMPTVTIPYNKIKPLLTNVAKKLIE